MLIPDLKTNYCHDHGGWGSDITPCKVCGKLCTSSTMPEMPKGLTWDEALQWGAKQITEILTPP